jgi:hypothetical protein
MNVMSSPVSQIDADSSRRQALAKVYKLVLSLAQEADGNTTSSESGSTNTEITIETAFVKEALLSQ